MSARLAEHPPSNGVFLDKQVFVVMLNHSGDRQVSWIHPCSFSRASSVPE
jgi:hypothetical protein